MTVAAMPVVLEQALFTSLRSASNEGYQIAAHSEGVDEAARGELVAWGPSHDSLQPGIGCEGSCNGHSLADGRWCLSLTRSASDEYSGRGRNVATWTLLAEQPALDLFGSHPLRLLDAALAAGWVVAANPQAPSPQPLPLVGRGRAVNLEAVAQACSVFSPEILAAIVTRALEPQPLAVALLQGHRLLIDALFSLLPLASRPLVSFTTGLMPSLRRPFRLHLLSPQTEVARTFSRTFSGGTVIDVTQETKIVVPKQAKRLAELLAAEQWCEVRRQVALA